VPQVHLTEIKDLFFKTLKDICGKGIDSQRMQDIIHKSILENYNAIEEHPHRTIQFVVIGHFLYGAEEQQLEQAFQEISRLEALKSKDSQYWVNVIREAILEKPYVCIEGKASIEMGKTLQDTEKARIEEQRKVLGEAKLQQLKIALEEATKKNELPIPDEIFSTAYNMFYN
jgi:Zn-dependent M16 (insulinase) family peptidase